MLAGLMIMPVAAQLPSMQETKWLGFFQGFETKHMRFGTATDGKASFRMISKKGDPVGQKLTIEGSFVIEETLPDGKRVKSSTTDSVDAGAPEFNGPGIAKAQVEFDSYQDHRFEAEATANSAMRLANSKPRPLRDGFTLTWAPDPAKDPGGKSRLVLDAK